MNRRGFMKVLLGCSAAATLPVIGKTVSNKPVIAVIAVDPAKPGSEKTVIRTVEDGGIKVIESPSATRFVRYESVRYIESTPSGLPDAVPRGYQRINGYARFKKNRNHLQEEINKIRSDRVSSVVMKRANSNAWNQDTYMYSAEHAKMLREKLHATKG